jgi:hypothetical protein
MDVIIYEIVDSYFFIKYDSKELANTSIGLVNEKAPF